MDNFAYPVLAVSEGEEPGEILKKGLKND